MAISNDERREVAKKLRELPSDVYEVEGQWKTEGISTDCHDQTDYYLIHDVLLECLPAEYMHPGDYEEFHERLADLIDRPTARNIADFDRESFKCSRCGYRVLSIDGAPDAAKLVAPEGGVIDFGYCPNCDAEVVDDARI